MIRIRWNTTRPFFWDVVRIKYKDVDEDNNFIHFELYWFSITIGRFEDYSKLTQVPMI